MEAHRSNLLEMFLSLERGGKASRRSQPHPGGVANLTLGVDEESVRHGTKESVRRHVQRKFPIEPKPDPGRSPSADFETDLLFGLLQVLAHDRKDVRAGTCLDAELRKAPPPREARRHLDRNPPPMGRCAREIERTTQEPYAHPDVKPSLSAHPRLSSSHHGRRATARCGGDEH